VMAWSRSGIRTFAGVALDLGIGVEVCWPYRPQEQGSVENLVGWVKHSFFKQRRFLDHTEGRSLILAGKPGRGKTHLAIAVAYRAIQNGFDAFFTTAAALIDDLSAAFRAGELANALPTYTHPAVLVVD
jgi:replication-associated recombination protein RarA